MTCLESAIGVIHEKPGLYDYFRKHKENYSRGNIAGVRGAAQNAEKLSFNADQYGKKERKPCNYCHCKKPDNDSGRELEFCVWVVSGLKIRISMHRMYIQVCLRIFRHLLQAMGSMV